MPLQSSIFKRLIRPALKMLGAVPLSNNRLILVIRLENLDLLQKYLGHSGFAHLMVQLSGRITSTVRPLDPLQIAAPGLFSVLLRTGSEIEAMRVALRVQSACQTALQISGMTVTPVISGVLMHSAGPTHSSGQSIVESARERLDEFGAAEIGRILMVPHDGRTRRPSQPATIAEAVAEGQIEAYFQPQICCNSGRITGFEALARWNHPIRGVLAPGAFLSGMNDLDHVALTHQMLRQSLAALRRWDIEGWDVPTVSLNVAQGELSDSGFADMVSWELDRQEIAPSRLVIELLESMGPINSCETSRANLARLAEAGCQIDLDDFGTGYASIGSISHFGVHRIKIDRSFVTGCHHDVGQQRLILAILALAERLGVSTIAEGVETVEENAFLNQIGVDQVQGYAIAAPMSLDRACAFIADYQDKQGRIAALLQRKAAS